MGKSWQACAARGPTRAAVAAEVDATRDVLARVEQVTAIVDRMEAAGEVARIEARLFRIEDAKLRARLAALESDLARATHAVESLIDLPPAASRKLTGEFASSARLAGATRDAALAAVADMNPAVLVARAEYELAERRLEEEVRKQWPDLDLAPGYGEQDGDRQVRCSAWAWCFLFSTETGRESPWPKPSARPRAAAPRPSSSARSARCSRRKSASPSPPRGVMRSSARSCPSSRLSTEETRAVARLGEVKTLVLLESLKQQLEARNDLIAARRDEALAAIDIEELLGPPQRTTTDGGSHP
jgi:outer membrane protein TolC